MLFSIFTNSWANYVLIVPILTQLWRNWRNHGSIQIS